MQHTLVAGDSFQRLNFDTPFPHFLLRQRRLIYINLDFQFGVFGFGTATGCPNYSIIYKIEPMLLRTKDTTGRGPH